MPTLAQSYQIHSSIGGLNGCKRKAQKRAATQGNSNVIEFNTFSKKQTVQLLPRNKHQETYILKLLDAEKSILFAIGPAGTGKTMLAVQAAVKKFKEGSVDKIIVTRPAVSVDEDLGFYQER